MRYTNLDNSYFEVDSSCEKCLAKMKDEKRTDKNDRILAEIAKMLEDYILCKLNDEKSSQLYFMVKEHVRTLCYQNNDNKIKNEVATNLAIILYSINYLINYLELQDEMKSIQMSSDVFEYEMSSILADKEISKFVSLIFKD